MVFCFEEVSGMPIYEYRCESCQRDLEKLQKISDPPLSECPECGAPGLRRKVSAPGFRLKGGGWYETDFKSGSKKNLAGESASSSSSGSDSKPAADAAKASPAAASSGT
jgi:putative FmdB family regulatory protein